MIGIDISDRSIKIVEIANNKNPVIRTLCWSPMSANLIRRGVVQDVTLVAEALQGAMQKSAPAPLEGIDVVASIPEVQSFVRVLELPKMSDREMEEAVQWAVRRHIPFDLDRVYLDWEVVKTVGSKKDLYQILVGAAQRDVVDPLMSVFDSLRLNVAALELEAQAVVRCLLPSDPADFSDIRGVLVVDLGATSTNIVLFDQGAMRYTTSIQWGGDDLTQQVAHNLGLSLETAIKKKAELGEAGSAGDPKVQEAVLESTSELVKKVERAVQEMAVQLTQGQRVRTVLLSGGNANLYGITDIFSSVFSGIPVQLGNPWTNLQQNSGKDGLNLSTVDAMHFTTAIGLALRAPDYYSQN